MRIGIIGLGDMGQMYAHKFSEAGYAVVGCDRPEKKARLETEMAVSGIEVLDDGVAVSRQSDLIIYSVEAENLEKAVSQYGPATPPGAVVAGQTSVKTPESQAFEKHLPKDVFVVTCHSLHGPSVDPQNQTLIVIRHRASEKAYQESLKIFKALGSHVVELESAEKHDQMTADTQAVTHVGFQSMGTAWKNCSFFPWENPSYAGGIDNVKVLLALRIYSGKSHVYAGLAQMNPFAKSQIKQYARSQSQLFKLMIQEQDQEFIARLERAGERVFGKQDHPILLDDQVMGEYGLNLPSYQRKPNSHLSLLAMVDAWAELDIDPYAHLIGPTPLYKLRLGVAEYLFREKTLLKESLHTALYDKSIRGDDLEFHSAVREWASTVDRGSLQGYKEQFEETQSFFGDRLEEGCSKSDELIRKLLE